MEPPGERRIDEALYERECLSERAFRHAGEVSDNRLVSGAPKLLVGNSKLVWFRQPASQPLGGECRGELATRYPLATRGEDEIDKITESSAGPPMMALDDRHHLVGDGVHQWVQPVARPDQSRNRQRQKRFNLFWKSGNSPAGDQINGEAFEEPGPESRLGGNPQSGQALNERPRWLKAESEEVTQILPNGGVQRL